MMVFESDFRKDPVYEYATFRPRFLTDGNPDISFLIHSFQDLATSQINRLMLGEEFERENSFQYVVLRYKGYFIERLCSQKEYTLITFPVQAGTLQLYRYALLLDENGKVVFYLISLWVLIDSITRKIKPAKPFRIRLAEKIPYIDDVLPLTVEKLSNFPIDNLDFSPFDHHKVSIEDIDSNGHMNNTVYIRIAQPTLERRLSSFEIDYEKECFEGENLILSKFHDGNTTVYVKGDRQDGTLSFKSVFLYS
jgi:acyl-ACP thioesterase